MHTVVLTWRQAAVMAAVLLGGGTGLRLARGSHARALAPFAREAGLLAGLYAMWQLAGTLAVVGTSDAFARGRWIADAERAWHLPSERDVQQIVLGHPLLTQACNLYYATMHFPALFALLIWLFVRYRSEYRRVRTTVVLLTASCLLMQLLPVAPPRLLPGLGFVDTAEQYGQSVYGAFAAVGADQLSAMPSVHVGWAVLVSVTAITVGRSPVRWLVLAHPLITVFVVSATANHFWLDGVVAVALLGLVLGAQAIWRRRAARSHAEPAASAPVTDELAAAR